MLLIVLEVYFSLLFSNKADFRVCFVARKIRSPLFFMSIPGTSVPNDKDVKVSVVLKNSTVVITGRLFNNSTIIIIIIHHSF